MFCSCIIVLMILAIFSSKINLFMAEIPDIACPEYFRYYRDSKGYFGKLTLPSISPGNTRVEVHISQKGSISQSNPSNILLYGSKEETTNNILNGKPTVFRVDFPDSNIAPKLTLISVDDATLCSDQEYPAPSTKIKLINNLAITVKSSMTPLVVRDKSSIAKKENSLNQKEKPTPATPSLFSDNPFLMNRTLSSSFVLPPTNTIYDFKANPSNLFLHQPTTVRKETGLNEICGRKGVAMKNSGTFLSRGEFPWLTAIYRKKERDLKFICGGSLISTRTVISAAHCFMEPKVQAYKILVLLGRNNLAAIDEDGSQQRRLESFLTHPEYDTNAISDADIALLKLQQPVTFTSYIAPICLWNTETDINKIVGFSAYTSGWGADENGDAVTEQPKKIETHIADDNACKRSLEDYQTMISSRTICVKAEKSNGPCTGDSGGGLAIYSNDRWTLRGIVSAGLTRNGKCFSHEYYYFCDIGKHMSWILWNMWT